MAKAFSPVEDITDLEDLDTISAMYGIIPQQGSTRRHATIPAPGAKHVAVHRRSVVHKPRMPTSLESKLQDARAQLYKQLGVPGDPQRPTSPGTLHRLLARMQSRTRTGKAGRATVSSTMPASQGSTAQGVSSRARPASLQLSSVTARTESGKLPSLSSPTNACHTVAPGARNRKTPSNSNSLAAVQDTSGDAGIAGWSAGRGRVSPYINFSLSILPTATEELARDKTLYYSPIGGLAGTSPHQFAGTLREPGSMLMYSTPQQKATILGQWEKVDARLQQQLLDAALAGPKLKALQQQGAAGPLDFETWMYGPQQDQQPLPPTVQRVQELAHKMQLHPNVLLELLGPDSEEQAWAGICEQQAGDGNELPQDRTAVGGECVQQVQLQKSVSYAPGCMNSSNRGSEAQDGSCQQVAGVQLGRTRSRVGAGRKVLPGMLRRAPVGFKALHAAGHSDSQPPVDAFQEQIDEGLKSAQYAQHTLSGAPIAGPRTQLHVPGCQQSFGQLGSLDIAGHSTTRATGACAGHEVTCLPATGIQSLQNQVPSSLSAGVRQQLPQVMGSQQTPLPSPRHGRQRGPSRCGSPPQQAAHHAEQTVHSGQVSSPARGKRSCQAPSASLVQPEGDALGAEVLGRISHRYVAAARQQEWQPWVPGAVRPSTGERWDYHTGVYDNHLAEELVTEQLLQHGSTILPPPHCSGPNEPATTPSPHGKSQGGKFATQSPWLLAFGHPEEVPLARHSHSQPTQHHLWARSSKPKALHIPTGVSQAASQVNVSLRASAPIVPSGASCATAQLEVLPSPSKQALRKMVGHSVLRWYAGQQRATASRRARSASSPHHHYRGEHSQSSPNLHHHHNGEYLEPRRKTGLKVASDSKPGSPSESAHGEAVANDTSPSQVLLTACGSELVRECSSKPHGAASVAPSLASSRRQKAAHPTETIEKLAQEVAIIAGRFDVPSQMTDGLIGLMSSFSSPSIGSGSLPAAGMLASLDISSAADKERDKLAASKARMQGSAVPRMGKEATVLGTRPYTSMHVLSQLQESRQVQQQLLAVERDLTPLFARQRQEQARKMGA